MTLLDPPSCSNIETRLTNVDQHCEIASSSRQGYTTDEKVPLHLSQYIYLFFLATY